MARPKEFDRNEVLEKAMKVFWAKGYERTSVRDLVAAMAINRGSLYDTFGGKQALYLSALERYCSDEARPLPAGIEGEPALATIRRYFQSIVEAGPRERKRGCFISNTIVEFGGRRGAITQTASAGVGRVEAAFTRLVVQAQAAGEIPTSHDPRKLARYLASSLNGLRLMAKTDASRGELGDIVDVTLSALG